MAGSADDRSFFQSKPQGRMMNLKCKAAFLTFVVMLAGCAASVQRSDGTQSKIAVPANDAKHVVLFVQGVKKASESKDWELLRTEWRTAIVAAAGERGITSTYWDTDQAATTETGTLVVINVNDYRYLSPGARYGFGIMTGNAYMDADASFYELPARKLLGSRKYNTSSTAWQGVFSAMTEKQVKAICDDIVREIAAAK
jgi:hypothetical protein